MSEAIKRAADEGLIRDGLHRVEAVVPAGDRLSRRALQSAGFRFEGLRRKATQQPDGGFGDLAAYSRLAGDDVHGQAGFTGVMNAVLPRKRCIAHVLFWDDHGRICLLETTFKDDWELPGGIVELNESPREGAIREVQEEVGLACSPGEILVVDWLAPYLGWEDAVELIFEGGQLTKETCTQLRPDPHEIRAIHWLTPQEAEPVMAPFARGRLAEAVAAHASSTGTTRYLERGRRVT
ncbi:MAG: NUDIX hydrolase [Micropruina sp.]